MNSVSSSGRYKPKETSTRHRTRTLYLNRIIFLEPASNKKSRIHQNRKIGTLTVGLVRLVRLAMILGIYNGN